MKCSGRRVGKLSFGILSLIAFSLAYNVYAEESESSWITVKSLEVRGLIISGGLHADSVFRVLTESDKISESDIEKDKNGSLIVTHHWKVDNQFIDIIFGRWDNMYRVQNIRVRKVVAVPNKSEKATSGLCQ